jgi:aspartate aminotransferase
VCVERDIMVLSDEVYEHPLRGRVRQPATFPACRRRERTIILHGFSKTYAMTGWRLGYGVMPLALAAQIKPAGDQLELVHVGLEPVRRHGGAAGPQQIACSNDGGRVQASGATSSWTGLNAIPGIRCVKPKGAFYVFPNITGTGMTSRECATFAHEAGVACLSGTLVRRAWRGVRAHLLRQLGAKYPHRAGAHPRGAGKALGSASGVNKKSGYH